MSGNKFQWKLNSRRIVLDHDHIYDIIIYRWVAQFCWRGEERRGERDARRLRIKGRPCVYSYHYNVKIKSTILYWVVCKVFGTYQYHAFNRRAYLLLNFCRNNRILVSSEFHSEENRIQTWIFIDLNDLKNHCHRQK